MNTRMPGRPLKTAISRHWAHSTWGALAAAGGLFSAGMLSAQDFSIQSTRHSVRLLPAEELVSNNADWAFSTNYTTPILECGDSSNSALLTNHAGIDPQAQDLVVVAMLDASAVARATGVCPQGSFGITATADLNS